MSKLIGKKDLSMFPKYSFLSRFFKKKLKKPYEESKTPSVFVGNALRDKTLLSLNSHGHVSTTALRDPTGHQNSQCLYQRITVLIASKIISVFLLWKAA